MRHNRSDNSLVNQVEASIDFNNPYENKPQIHKKKKIRKNFETHRNTKNATEVI